MHHKFTRLTRRTFLVGLGTMVPFLENFFHQDNNLLAQNKAPKTLTIVYQPGIGYASLLIVKELGILERRLPETKIEWRILSTGAAVRDAVISGQAQFGSGGIGPFLVGWDRGVNWRLLASLNHQELWLVVKDPRIQSLKDFRPEDKIGMPGLDSIQSVILRKAAQTQLGNAKALDRNLVAISHPLGLQSLINGQIAGHLTAPHFQFLAQDQGARILLKSWDVLGTASAASIFATDQFYNDYPEVNQLVFKAITDANQILNSNIGIAARYLAAEGDNKIPPDKFKQWMTNPAVKYSLVPKGFLRFAAFMKEIGMIRKQPQSIQEIVHPTLARLGGD